ncbi:Cupin [Kluyvera cryocrescens]|uniref:Cupin n=1 Tax=Kluyvera cryocrescens TaxID=580 RepID=A0A485ALS8_KLUCR|nr:Cupin [Kluyvera cryocrescens]
MDPLSELLSLLKPQSYASGGLALSQNMAISWPDHQGIKCYSVVSGQCWLSVEGVADKRLLTAGDCYLMPPGPSFTLATSLSVEPVDFAIIVAEQRRVNTADGGGAWRLLCRWWPFCAERPSRQYVIGSSAADCAYSEKTPIRRQCGVRLNKWLKRCSIRSPEAL